MANKRKYKVKLLPIIIVVVTLILIVVIFGYTYMSIKDKVGDNPHINTTPPEETTTPTDTSTLLDDAVTTDEWEQPSTEEQPPLEGEPSVEETPYVEEPPVVEAVVPEVEVIPSIPTNALLRDWNLLLINADNGISSDLNFAQTSFDSQVMDARLKDNYTAMYEDAKAAGITLYIRIAYKSIKQQQALYTKSVQDYMEQGLSRESAIVTTNQEMPQSGHCEHHSGLGLDIITPEYHREYFFLDAQQFVQTTAYTWLVQNAHNYGFVLRYPADKTNITNMSFEPWHFRYVGVDNAKYMVYNNLCLEEYIVVLSKLGR